MNGQLTRRVETRKLVFVALCIAIGLLLPQMARFVPLADFGSILLPMHIPVLICGYVAGSRYGLLTGFILPLLAFFLTGMPPLFPVGVSMMFELAAYGFLTGFFYKRLKGNVLVPLIIAMIGGRLVYGVATAIFFGMANIPFGFEAFISGGFIVALPGIIIQFIIIPPIIHALKNARLVTDY